MEILNFLQDAYQHLLVSRQRKFLRLPGQGYDYGTELETGRQLVASLHPKRMQLQLVEIIPETPSTKTLRFERKDAPLPPFRAGQYLNVFVDVDGILTSRPYSISSVPGAATLDLTVKRKPGGFVSPYLLNEFQVGDVLLTTGPKGKFYFEELIDGDQLVFLAGGSGITPFMSIIQDTLSRSTQNPIKMHLIYGSRVPGDVIFAQKLVDLAERHPNFSFTQVISEPPVGYQGHTGFLDSNLIQSRLTDPSNGILPDLSQNKYYICGPNVMYAFCLNALQELGIPPHRIKRELYGPPDDVSLEPGWPIEIQMDQIFQVEIAGDKVIQAPAGEPLMNSLERYGVVIPAVCRSGSCSACRLQLVSGKVFHPASARLRQADRQHGFIHACVAYPLEDLTIRI
jgi:ferredoxin-NADP reductase